MSKLSGLDLAWQLSFSAPWDRAPIRRGDALGLRALADEFSETVAPELSNRINDGRWVSILAWCLCRSHAIFRISSSESRTPRQEQHERYAWLQPLELMWVARTIGLAPDWDKRSIAGRNSVRKWLVRFKSVRGEKSGRFGMTPEQFTRYRQTGMYGGYRLAFRKWPGLTIQGDGWPPGKRAELLANWIDARLGAARPDWKINASPALRGKVESKSQWWIQKWPQFGTGTFTVSSVLPSSRMHFQLLPEAKLLSPVIFGDDQRGTRRKEIAEHLAGVDAANHLELCEHLPAAFPEDGVVALLPAFSRLADAGMDVMDYVSSQLVIANSWDVDEAIRSPELTRRCNSLIAAARAWRVASRPTTLRHIESANRLAEAVWKLKTKDCLFALVAHHVQHGGGARWFVRSGNTIELRNRPFVGASRYRFRLWALCRLAVQCGIIATMPSALQGDPGDEQNEEEAEQ